MGARAASAVPPRLLARLRAMCLALPGAVEEPAWVGTRWTVRRRNFAHVVPIAGGWPPAYARAAASHGPLVVLTFRISPLVGAALADAGPRFFVAPWGTRWGTQVGGLKLGPRVDWAELEGLVVESYRLLAPQKLVAALAARPPT